jgi:hypothetical protein
MRAETEAPSRIGKALAALLLATAPLQSGAARAGSHGGGGVHGGGGFHGGGFHGGAGGFHGGSAGVPRGGFGGFHGGGFHAHGFHGGEFHHHGFRRGLVVVPAFGGAWWGAGLGWPYYSYPDESYYGYGPYSQNWYCDNPAGYYPYVQQCNSGWQMVPAN